jgi:hypothetical protein
MTVARRLGLVPTPPPELGPDGRVRTDGGGHQTAGRRTGGHQRLDTGRPDIGQAGHWTHWTPDGRTLDGWTAGPGRRNRMVDTTRWTRTGDRHHGWCPDIADHDDNARPLDAGLDAPPGRRRLGVNNQDSSAARTTRTGPVTAATVSCRRYSAVQLRLGALLSCVGFGWYEWRAMGLRKVGCAGSGWCGSAGECWSSIGCGQMCR